MNIGDRVVIGGRTMLRPGFSLVGLQGVVVPSAPNAPAGCATVMIDWQSKGYGEDDDLPLFVNVPLVHLDLADAVAAPPAARPALGLVGEVPVEEAPADEEAVAPEEGKIEPESSHEPPEDERPRLRLI